VAISVHGNRLNNNNKEEDACLPKRQLIMWKKDSFRHILYMMLGDLRLLLL